MYRIVWASHDSGLPIVPPLPNDDVGSGRLGEDDRTLASRNFRGVAGPTCG